MTEMGILCRALAGVGEKADALHRQLRWFGCLGSVHGLASHLKFLVQLEPGFSRLAVDYPRLANACSLMQDAGALLAALDKLHASSVAHAANVPASAGPDLLRSLEAAFAEPSIECPLAIWPARYAPGPVQLVLVAAAHLLIRVWTGHATAPPLCARVLAALAELQDRPDLLVATEPGTDESATPISVPSICRALIDEAAAREKAAQGSPATKAYFQRAELASFADLLARTDTSLPYQPKLIHPKRSPDAQPEPEEVEDEVEPVREWGNRGSQLLLDRELLPEATYGLSAREASALAATFGPAPIAHPDRVVTRTEMLASVGGCLALAGALTASSIAEAAAIPVEVVDGDALPMPAARAGGRQIVIQRGRQEVARWWPAQEQGANLCVDADELDLGLSAFHRHFVLDELLPLPIAEIRLAVLKHIGKQIQRSKHQADLCVKHLLARHVFALTVNRGIVSHLCTTYRPVKPKSDGSDAAQRRGKLSEGEDLETDNDDYDGEDEQANVRRESLSNYIHPQSAAVLHAYRAACRAIRFPEVADSEAPVKPRVAFIGKTWVDAERLAKVMDWMARRALNRSKKSAIQHHNDFVLYVAAMLVVGLGYRRSRAILPFAHDLNLAEAVAFIADKMREGSEARFVPVVDALLRQIKAYLAHVQFLVAELGKTDATLAKSIEVAVGLQSGSGGQARVRHAGPFFRIRGGRAVPVTTVAVDWVIREALTALGLAQEPRIETRALRRNLASWLGDDGIGGAHIEMILGHVREKHTFGPSSVWIPKQAFESMREPMARYLDEMGCKYIGAPWARAFAGRFAVATPSFESSGLAYEGRKIESDEARMRARQSVLSVVPEDVLLDDQAVDLTEADLLRIEASIRASFSNTHEEADDIVDKLRKMAAGWRDDSGYAVPRSELLRPAAPIEGAYSDADHLQDPLDAIRRAAHRVLKKSQIRGQRVLLLDDDTVRKLSDRIDVELKDDQAARAKVKVAFAELAASWRRTGQYRVTAAALNLTRHAAGPVDVCFSRHLAIAQAVIEGLPDRIESFLSKGSSAKSSLAVVAVLLVCCDAVLNRAELVELMQVLQNDGFAKFEGQLQLRAGISAKEAEYDRTVDLTYKTAAAVQGYLQRRKNSPPLPMPQIEAEANLFLKQVMVPRGAMNLDRLLVVMRPYWFLRLPGSVFASITGAQECNAPSAQSMALLLGAPAPELRMSPPAPRGPKTKRSADSQAALAAVAELLAEAEGRISEFHGASRQQRMRLRQAFSGRHRPQLQAWMMRVPVVELAVQFVYYMLEVGGFRVQTYSYESLQTYRRRVLPQIFEVAWHVDLLALDSDGLGRFFRAVIARVDEEQRQAAKAPLRLFLRFLHQWNGAPNTRFDASTEARPRRARNVVVPTRIAEEAVKRATRPDGKGSQVAKAGATLLGVNHAFGLRPCEGYGLKVSDFLDNQRTSVRVRINVIRSLKTFQRTVPISLASDTSTGLLEERVAAAGLRGKETKFSLFADEDRIALYDDAQLYAVGNWAIKRETGDQDAIAYSLRHSFATSVMNYMLEPGPSGSPIAARVSESLRLPSSAQMRLKTLQPIRDRWPHQIDRLGAWMGHAGTGTLSRTYWHGAWWCAAERCAQEALERPWRSEVIGALLGVSGAAVRGRFEKREDGKRATDGERTASAMTQLVESMPVSELAPQPVVVPKKPAGQEWADARPVVSVLDAMLIQRHLGAEDFADLAAAAAQRLSVPLQQAKAFFDAYSEVGSLTAMQDFEPDELRPDWLAAHDLEAGADRRDELLALVMQRMAGDEGFAQATRDLLADWRQEVDGEAEQPWLVSRSLSQWKRHVQWLKQVGYDPVELNASHFAAVTDQAEKCAEVVPNPQVSHKRLSRAVRIGQRSEFGLAVRVSRRLPIGRDLHRVLLALACADRAGTLPAA